ncbi:ornithine aminotransferase [Friedmanniomyces endolithicus]|nr:ornithine aminotransferase [Friedmanniomyces endolithicus]KAK0770716.1 ornithine aminotransferase [Friedmanniomyces endolithicus]KAK0808821.1 ornithine aminotransferase [Friedmanniomyces endolithicus]
MIAILEQADDERVFPRFMDLPPELRVEIYGHHFRSFDEGILAVQPPLTTVCKLLRQEALPMFYRSHRFGLCAFNDDYGADPYNGHHFRTTSQIMVRDIWVTNLSRIRKLRLHRTDFEGEYFLDVDLGDKDAPARSCGSQNSRPRDYQNECEKTDARVTEVLSKMTARPGRYVLQLDDALNLIKALPRSLDSNLPNIATLPPNMAPMAIDEDTQTNGHTNGHANGNGTLNAKAATFTPSTSASPSSPYHAASSASAMDTEAAFAAHNYHPLPIVFAKGSGCSVWDPEGKHYLDFLSAYSAVNQGHCHPKLIQALTEQAGRLTLSSRAFYNDVFPKFAEKITKMTGFDMVLPMNTGAEAVETAVKIARKWGYKVKGIPKDKALVFSVQENFHGRTAAAIAMSTDPESRDNYGPYLPNVGPLCPVTKKVIPYNDVKAVEEAFEAHGKETAGFLVEPIQGEAGIVVPDEDYLQRIRELCDKHNVLLICDEIQTGIARTGRLLCHEWSGIKPDLVLLGKAISGGMYPVSCVLGRKDVMLTIEPGTHGSTYGGNPLGSAVAIKALEIVEEEQLVERAERLGEIFREGLREIQKRDPMITIVRGKGLLNAMVIDEEKAGGHTAWDLCMLMKEKGLLVGRALKIAHHGANAANGTSSLLDQGANGASTLQAKPTHQNIIRMAPPLVITEEQIRTALRIIEEAMRELPGLKGEEEKKVLPEGEKGVQIGLEN